MLTISWKTTIGNHPHIPLYLHHRHVDSLDVREHEIVVERVGDAAMKELLPALTHFRNNSFFFCSRRLTCWRT